MAQKTFTTSNGRKWISVPDPGGGKNIGLYYEATEAEVNRVKNKTYTDNGRQISGEPYIAVVDGKNYVLHSSYSFESNRYVYRPYPPAEEIENGNYQQFQEIEKNTSLKEQITESQSQNTSTTNPNQPGAPGESTPSPDPNKPGDKSAEEKPYLIYPLTMKDTQDRIMFEAYEYQSGGRLLSGENEGEFGQLNPVRYVNPKGKVFLPIQSAITDQNAVGWESDTLNPIEVQVAELSEKLMLAPTPKQMGTELASFYNQALTAAKFSNQQIRTYLVGQAIGVNNLLSRLQGQVLNPNLELLFQGPQLRPFSFTFKLSPRGAKEAREVKQIIKYFKKNMAVKKDNVIFLKAPNVFKIQYQYGGEDGKPKPHPGLNLIKMCALTNCSVDYTPLGSYMTYEDGTMVSYTISLSFQELTPIYDTDYDKQFDYGETPASPVPATYYTEDNGIGP